MTRIIINESGAFLTKTAAPIFLSGGFGSEVDRELSHQGETVDSLQKGSAFRAPLHAPPIVERVHALYAEAGADILTADSFCASMGRTDQDESLARRHAFAAASIARKASGANPRKPLVALSLTSSGDCYTPGDTPDNGPLAEEHSVNLQILENLGDLVIAETLPTLREAQIIASIANKRQIPFIASFVVNDDGTVLDGSSMNEVIETILRPHPYGLGVGVNCCSIGGAKRAVDSLSEASNADPALQSKHIVAYPNAFKLSLVENEKESNIAAQGGCAHTDHNKSLTPEEGAALVRDLTQRGASVVGLCCGSTPAHTQHYADRTRARDHQVEGPATPAALEAHA